MINNDWERFGDEIRRTIQDAVDNRDFSRLNQTVSDTLGRAMDNVSRGMRNGGWYRDNPLQKGRADQPGGNMNGGYGAGAPGGGFNPDPQKAAEGQRMQRQSARPAKKLLYLKGTSTKIGGIFLAVTGYVFTVGTIIFLLLLTLGAAATGWDLVMQIGMGIFGLFGLAFVIMALAGTNMVCSVGRFRKYVNIIKDREYCDVKELAQKTGRSAKAV